MKFFFKYGLQFFGCLSLILGIIGIFLPLLPTTPFLLLSASLFAKSSKKFYNWLINHKYLGSYIRQFKEDKSISLHTKIISISLVWISIGYSAIYVVPLLPVKILLFIIAIAVSIHIASFKTRKKS
ncbi:MAG: YbaN family protein [Paludibacteraceae bacterium]|nr:YbaN family protein [Paludibacteraceae bacterium]MBN2788426.1 YbaN family protein [Paludibacteraceae bacterium]